MQRWVRVALALSLFIAATRIGLAEVWSPRTASSSTGTPWMCRPAMCVSSGGGENRGFSAGLQVETWW